MPALVHRPLVREHPLLPAGQEHGVELQALGAVQGHQGDHVAGRVLDVVHDQADVLEEAGQRLELGERLDQLLEVLEPAGRVGGAVLLPHPDVAGLLEHRLGHLARRHPRRERAPALEVVEQAR